MTSRSGIGEIRERIARFRTWLERLLIWRVWERMLEIEFLDRSIALAGKAFVSFFPLVIVVAAFVPERTRASIISTIAARLGLRGDAFSLVQSSFASSDDIRRATGLFGLVLTIFFATSFTTALQRVYLRAWRRPPHSGVDTYWRGATWLFAVLVSLALLGGLRDAAGEGTGIVVWAVVALAVNAGLWWFTAWWFLLGNVRAAGARPDRRDHRYRDGRVRAVGLGLDARSGDEKRITVRLLWGRAGAGDVVLRRRDLHPVGACAGPVFAEDSVASAGSSAGRGSDPERRAQPGAPAPDADLSLRDAFRTGEDK